MRAAGLAVAELGPEALGFLVTQLRSLDKAGTSSRKHVRTCGEACPSLPWVALSELGSRIPPGLRGGDGSDEGAVDRALTDDCKFVDPSRSRLA